MVVTSVAMSKQHTEYMRQYMATHPEQRERSRERAREWRAKNREAHRAYSLAYHHAHHVPAIRASIEERFWRKVEKTEGCWLWRGAISGKGRYGYFGVTSKKLVRAHRWAYEATVGPIPAGLELDHLCGNTICVRPDHLEAVTHLENVRRWAQSKKK